jgi:hypothetical protein
MATYVSVPTTNVDVMTNHLRICPAINISTQNVQSLNISTLCKKTSQKICSITRELDDIILLSDIRLNSEKQATAIEDIRKRFKFRGYDLFSILGKIVGGPVF